MVVIKIFRVMLRQLSCQQSKCPLLESITGRPFAIKFELCVLKFLVQWRRIPQ